MVNACAILATWGKVVTASVMVICCQCSCHPCYLAKGCNSQCCGHLFSVVSAHAILATWEKVVTASFMVINFVFSGQCSCHPCYLGKGCNSLCNGHGTCSDTNQCVCDEAWRGSKCEVRGCPGEGRDCSGHGECNSALQTCRCNPGELFTSFLFCAFSL